MAYLDYTGLQTLWAKIKSTFALKSHGHDAYDVTSTVEGIYITTGTLSKNLKNLDGALKAAVNTIAEKADKEHTHTAEEVSNDYQGEYINTGEDVQKTLANLDSAIAEKTDENVKTQSLDEIADGDYTVYLAGTQSADTTTGTLNTVSGITMKTSVVEGKATTPFLDIENGVIRTFGDDGNALSVTPVGVYFPDGNSIEEGYYTGKADTAGTADNALAVPWTGVTGKPDWIGDSLPTATASTLGGVKVGSGLSITSAGVLSATGGSGAQTAKIWTGICTDDGTSEKKKVVLDDATGFPSTPTVGTRLAVTFTSYNDSDVNYLQIYDANDNLLCDNYSNDAPCIYVVQNPDDWGYSATNPYGTWAAGETVLFTYHTDGGWLYSPAFTAASAYYLASTKSSAVTGVKGNSESTYRTGNVNLTAANIGAAASSHTHAASDITSGTLSAARGGTGYTTLQATRSAMGLGNTTGAVPIANGGTGSTTAANARSALGITCANIGAATSGHTHTGAAAANDYVTAQGVSSSWYYRKWNSGKKECWRGYSFTTGTMSSSGDIYYYEATMPAYPWTWSSLQNLQVSAYCQYPMWCAENSTNRTTSHPGNVTVFRTAAANNKTVYLMMYAYGW